MLTYFKKTLKTSINQKCIKENAKMSHWLEKIVAAHVIDIDMDKDID